MDQKPHSCLVKKISPDRAESLRAILYDANWTLSDAPYCAFKAVKDKTSLAFYLSGKVVIQGKNASDCLEFILEPNGFCAPELPKEETPFFPHAGLDESGKGDFFGPLVVACAFVRDAETARKLADAGVRDSKLIKSDAVMTKTAQEIKNLIQNQYGMVVMGPNVYNSLYCKIGNLNRLLAWGHARALENLMKVVPECPAVLADQFGDEHLIRDALLRNGRSIDLTQRTKAESDIAVAAASILARAEFVRRIKLLEEQCGASLPKGASAAVSERAKELADKGGRELLESVAKMHFRTAYRALGLPEPEHRDWHEFHKHGEK